MTKRSFSEIYENRINVNNKRRRLIFNRKVKNIIKKKNDKIKYLKNKLQIKINIEEILYTNKYIKFHDVIISKNEYILFNNKLLNELENNKEFQYETNNGFYFITRLNNFEFKINNKIFNFEENHITDINTNEKYIFKYNYYCSEKEHIGYDKIFDLIKYFEQEIPLDYYSCEEGEYEESYNFVSKLRKMLPENYCRYYSRF